MSLRVIFLQFLLVSQWNDFYHTCGLGDSSLSKKKTSKSFLDIEVQYFFP